MKLTRRHLLRSIVAVWLAVGTVTWGAQGPTPALPSATAPAAPAGATPANPATKSAAGPAAPARNVAGTIDLVDGASHVVAPDKSSHTPKVGDKVFEGDSVVTDPGAELHIQMADGGFIAIRPNSALAISRYQANGDSDDHSVIALVHGSLRSITGWIGKAFPRNYAINTPDATIGVRGTDHETAYLPDAGDGSDAGTYDTVHAGGTTLSTAHGRVDVSPDHAGFVGRSGSAGPRVLDHVPKFFSAPHRNDARMVGMHDRISASYQQRRAARVQEHAQELRHPAGSGGRPTGGGELLHHTAPVARPLERPGVAHPLEHPEAAHPLLQGRPPVQAPKPAVVNHPPPPRREEKKQRWRRRGAPWMTRAFAKSNGEACVSPPG